MSFLPRRTAYYFRQHLYTLVPRHLDEDLAWMREAGFDSLALALLEQDATAAAANLDAIFAAAERRGLRVLAVPSRWGGLVAGAPKVPSLFAATHPETWALQADGAPRFSPFGPVCSVHHPAVFEFFRAACLGLVSRWPFAGLIWDEPKALGVPDHSPAAEAAGGRERVEQLAAQADFFERVSAEARRASPELRVAVMLFSNHGEQVVDVFARLPSCTEIGCDGRPWSRGAVPQELDPEEGRKSLLDDGGRFLEIAARRGKRSLMLIENHNLPFSHLEALRTGLPRVLALGADQLMAYYYPRNVRDPDGQMALIKQLLQVPREGGE